MMMHDPERDDKRAACKLCGAEFRAQDSHCCPTNPLTCGEQQEALLLLRYWYECSRGGLEPDLAVVQITKLLIDKHPART